VWNRRKLITVIAGSGIAVALTVKAETTVNDRLTGDLSPVHDPCMIKGEGLYHVFCTSQMREGKGLIHWRTSPDMLNWTYKGSVITAFPHWVIDEIPDTRGAWAPDISYVNGRYHLYYSASLFGKNHSVIGLLTTPTLDTAHPDFGWKDEGLVVRSREGDRYNAIDPNHVVDADGRHWLSFGSFWSGLQLVELDPATGRPKTGVGIKRIAGRSQPGAIEAPFIFRRDDWYYLVAAYDFCCRGVDSSYYTCIGRSKTISGPYVDDVGKKLTDGGGKVLLKAGEGDRFKGPGGASVYEENGAYFIVYHAYDAEKNGKPVLRIQNLGWTADGWPNVV
jgi:arabinan endo-1,5-alpha-L-arabinosidase